MFRETSSNRAQTLSFGELHKLRLYLKENLFEMDSKQFEDICFSLLNLLGPSNYDRRTGPSGKGSDFVLSFEGKHKSGLKGLWLVECKGHKKNIGIEDVAKSIVYYLKNNSPHDVMLFALTSDLSNPAKDFLQNNDSIASRRLCGDHIVELLINNPELALAYFPSCLGVVPSLKNLKNNGFQISMLEWATDDNKARKQYSLKMGEVKSVEYVVTNLSDETWIYNAEIDLPQGMSLVTIRFNKDKINPLEEMKVTITFRVDRRFDANNKSPFIKIEGPAEKIVWRGKTPNFVFENEVSFPFKGRENESHLFDEFYSRPPGLIIVEGDPGTGKSRLIEESLLSTSCIEEDITRIGAFDLTDAHNIARSIFIKILNQTSDFFSIEDAEIILKSRLEKQYGISDGDFCRFLLGISIPNRSELLRFISYANTFISQTRNYKHIFLIDDFHHISPSGYEIIEQFIKTLEKTSYIIISYRNQEIDQYLRENTIKLSDEVVHVKPLTQQAATQILEDICKLEREMIASLVMLTEGNPYCLFELTSNLYKRGVFYFNTDGKLQMESGRLAEYEKILNAPFKNIIGMTYEFAVKRFEALVKLDKGRGKLIEKMALIIAAFGKPLPLTVFENHFESDWDLIDELLFKSLLRIEKGAFGSDDGIYLIHDRMVEALSSKFRLKRVLWRRINRELITILKEFPKELQSSCYRDIANCWEIVGDSNQVIEYLHKDFKHCIQMDYQNEIQISGKKCIEVIESLPTHSLSTDRLIAEIQFHLGKSFYIQRKYYQMDKSFSTVRVKSAVNSPIWFATQVYQSAADIKRDPQHADTAFRQLTELSNILKDKYDEDSYMLDAYLHSLDQLFLYYKQYHGDYVKAIELNEIAINICKEKNLQDKLIWELINKGTFILFSDEDFRNRFASLEMENVWQRVIEHWENVLELAENSLFTERVIEANCAVGFMKMFTGFHFNDTPLQNMSVSHFNRARAVADQYGHPFWLSKLHNHYGIHHALEGDFEKSELELRKGLILSLGCTSRSSDTKENHIKNYYTSWMMQQNLANIHFLRGSVEDVDNRWQIGFEIAVNQYFSSNILLAVRNYNFRQFLRGYYIHCAKYPALSNIIDSYPTLLKEIKNDEGLNLFIESLPHSIGELEKMDMYCFQGCYFNTH